jgi:DNA-binding FadR family transcriptional regulator
MPLEHIRRESAEALLRSPRSNANAFGVTVERLGSSIKMGLFAPGEQLPTERELCDLMGVSRTTVREAIRVLTVQGMLEVRRGRSGGTFVSGQLTSPSVQELQARVQRRGGSLIEVLDHRLVVETGIAELAAERRPLELRPRLTELASRMHDAEDDFSRYRTIDTQFHFLIARATGVDRLSTVLAELHAELSDLMAMVPHSRDACAHSTQQHERIAKAIVDGNATKARKEMRDHVLATTSFLKGLLG